MPKNRLAPDLHHRLWSHVGFFANPCAAAAREDNHFHKCAPRSSEPTSQALVKKRRVSRLGQVRPLSAAREWLADPPRIAQYTVRMNPLDKILRLELTLVMPLARQMRPAV